MIAAKQILKYVFLPQVVPRVKELVGSGFAHVALFMAQIYRAARLLPAGHPYLYYENVGRFGIRHVLSEAASNLSFRKQNIDQILVYFIILFGLAIIGMQMVTLTISLFVQTAQAAGISNFSDLFGTDDPTYDIAFVLMDRVFGLRDMFGSCVAQGIPCTEGGIADGEYPYPFHIALQNMFQFYSMGLLIVATLIFIYFVIAVVAETAQSGTPFGKRFNHVWAPIRMVVAIGLLVPVTQNLNSAQWILMYAAKWGSGFATNGWELFVDTALGGAESGDMTGGSGNTRTLAGNPVSELLATPNAPEANDLVSFFTLVSACKYAKEDNIYAPEDPVNAYLYNPTDMSGSTNGLMPLPSDYDEAVAASDGRTIAIHFVRESEHDTPNEPVCGSIRLNVTVTQATEQYMPGAYALEKGWYDIVQQLWDGVNNANTECPEDESGYNVDPTGSDFSAVGQIGYCAAKGYMPVGEENIPRVPTPTEADVKALVNILDTKISALISHAVAEQAKSSEWDQVGEKYGWAGAGIWYNKIAELNGSLIGSVYNVPQIQDFPAVMNEVLEQKTANNAETDGMDRFNPKLSGDTTVRLANPEDEPLAQTLYNVTKMYEDVGRAVEPTGNVFIDVINLIFGTKGLLDMRQNIENNTHPLAALTAIGKSLMESAISTFKISLFSGAIGTLAGDGMFGMPLRMFSGFLTKITTMALSIGFVLYYIIPFLPFIYFFFAVSGWIKCIFEAMVGVPLWALAHIRIDGNGLPGDAAVSGYFMIMEIFLRPILIIFGMLASITIFSAQIYILNEIWDVVIANVAGYDPECIDGETCVEDDTSGLFNYIRGTIDQFFYTVIFAVITYMLGMASFKLVDMIPNQIFRWMGVSISVFQEQRDDPAQGLVKNAMYGGQMVSGPMSSALDGGKRVGAGAKAYAQGLFKNNSNPS